MVVSQMTDKETKETDVISFGQNNHGQVDGFPSEEPVLRPKIVPFFIGKKVKFVSAS